MQRANLLKRRSIGEGVEPWSAKPKRMCLETEQQVAEYPMETSHFVPVTNQQQVVAVLPRPPQVCCPRCLGGESGHINHTMGL
ncbi:uncharacterized protein [Nothobranchius furzeri]|uniref:uncharacterized protein isoform X2 n=1 Tax=Nothobranchius furzeri TaxID=105023 RepID=UPI003904B180